MPIEILVGVGIYLEKCYNLLFDIRHIALSLALRKIQLTYSVSGATQPTISDT